MLVVVVLGTVRRLLVSWRSHRRQGEVRHGRRVQPVSTLVGMPGPGRANGGSELLS